MTLVFMTGCSQYEYEALDAGLTVTESLLEFTANGGEGYILVESDKSIEAKSNSDWCQVLVNGKKIKVTVASFSGVENRTAVVAISAGGDYPVNVPVTQKAAKFIIADLVFDVDYIAGSVQTKVISDEAVTVSTSDDWITVDYNDGTITIDVLFNPIEKDRTGTVEVTSKNITQTIIINQAARRVGYSDFVGEWELSYINTINGEDSRTVINVELKVNEEGKSYQLLPISNGGATDGSLIVDYSERGTESVFTIKNAQQLPNYASFKVLAVAWNVETSFTTAPAVTYEGAYRNVEGKIIIEFADNGSWGSDDQVNGLLIGAFHPTDGDFLGYLYSMDYIKMVKK